MWIKTKAPAPQSLLRLFLLIGLLVSWGNPAQAQLEKNQIDPLSQGDINYMGKQRGRINDLAKRYLGMQLRQERQNDIEVLQKILDQNLVKADDVELLQAMGMILGDIYVKELGVHWVVYQDRLGRSRALQWSNEETLLFPVTMISRRIEAGIKVNIEEVYNKGLAILTPIVKNISNASPGRHWR